ncbi:unnamed protein product [Adineta ricciae]|nr:unnamed protein product [Adineta ricciae]
MTNGSRKRGKWMRHWLSMVKKKMFRSKSKTNNIDNIGAHVYFDATGLESTFTTGIASLTNGARAILIAMFEEPVKLNAMDIVLRGITIKGNTDYRQTFPEVIQLIDSKRLNVEQLITKKVKLNDIVKAFRN